MRGGRPEDRMRGGGGFRAAPASFAGIGTVAAPPVTETPPLAGVVADHRFATTEIRLGDGARLKQWVEEDGTVRMAVFLDQ
jgi:hypothetical protein